MKRVRSTALLVTLALFGLLLLGGCASGNASSSGGQSKAPSSGGKAAPKQAHPTGDIPDTQAFVTYTSTKGGYKLVVPEGWARTVKGGDVSFVSKLDGLSVTLKNSAKAPSVASVQKNLVPALKKSEQAVSVSSVQGVNLPSGKAVLITYNSNSKPNSVTGKQVRLENNSYVFYKNGKLATLRLYAPLGADNVDQWHRISDSFGWK